GFSIVSFLRHRLRNGDIGLMEVGRTLRDLVEFASDGIDNLELITRGIHEWRGQSVAELEELGEVIHRSELEECVFPEMRMIIEAHRRQQHTLVIATSATEFQVKALARSLGIEHVLATKLTARRGILTGAVDGKLLWGTNKAQAAREWAAEQSIDLATSWFYADGAEDAALMHLVGHPRPVNPRSRMRRIALRRGWPMQTFASRGPSPSGALLRRTAAIGSVLPVTLGAMALEALTGEKRHAANLLTTVVPDVALALAGVRLNVSGEEHLWSHRPAVFLWNHRNMFDAQIVGKLVHRDFGAVAKRELANVPIFALASRFMHIAFLDRSDSRAAVEQLAPATRLLSAGYSMVVAPEGTRVRGNEVGPFKKGAFRMAMAAGVPVVPIVIRNADILGTRSERIPRPGTVDIAVLPPVDVTDWTLDSLGDRIEAVRQSYIETLRQWPGPISL
ncbi:MAG TPA: HAD-IB family hydrolase, partial [Steroidobacteraceae bacterium]|nr:HAD-IB family hydrolase [Steroidobacteraceae bacterium]